MNAMDAVLEACRLMGVPFAVLDKPPSVLDKTLSGFVHGPAAGGCHPTLGVYMLRHDMDSARTYSCDVWAWALHELSHVVWWHPERGANVCEMPLIAWEYAVARHFGITGFFDCYYTTETSINVGGADRLVGNWERPQRAAWFARARQECVRRGALTPDFKPTWRRPIMRLDEHDYGWETL